MSKKVITLQDDWEIQFFGSITAVDGTFDSDGDGLFDADEEVAQTNPLVKDSDNDGLDDGAEVAHALNPLIDEATANKSAVIAAYRETLQRGHGEVLVGHPTIWVEDGQINLSVQLWGGEDLKNLSEMGNPIEFSTQVPVSGVEFFRISVE